MTTQSKFDFRPISRIGFVGLGVMGGPMCANLVQRRGRPVIAFDLQAEALQAAEAAGAQPAASLAEVGKNADLIILSLPDGRAVENAVLGKGGLAEAMSAGGVIIDTSTAPVALTRSLHETLLPRGIAFIDAPVARTREAARRGELSIMVGASPELFVHVQPILATMGTDVTLCGAAGCGQLVKILNNMLLFMNVAALAEAMVIAGRSGLAPEVLLATVAIGSGDSFALRNHGMKAMLPRAFPERAFSTRYAIKDLSYALQLAEAAGVDAAGARLAMARLAASEAAGNGDRYFPALLDVIDPQKPD